MSKEQYHKIWVVKHIRGTLKGTYVEIYTPINKVQDLVEKIQEVTEQGLERGDYEIEVTTQDGKHVTGDDVYIDIVSGNYPNNNN